MKRKIVQIDAEKCDGCGLCARACHERAIEIVAGKAKLISDTNCDGLGDCLPACPRGAIQITEREALAYDEAAVQRRQQEQAGEHGTGCRNGGACPGSAARRLSGGSCPHTEAAPVSPAAGGQSELRQWPVQLALANPRAEYFQGTDLLFAADCAAYAYANLHRDFMAGHVTLIGCPKLDGAGGAGRQNCGDPFPERYSQHHRRPDGGALLRRSRGCR